MKPVKNYVKPTDQILHENYIPNMKTPYNMHVKFKI